MFKIYGRWRYAFRAIDEDGQIVDVVLSDHRDAASAGAFFEQAITSTEVIPMRVTTDKAKCYPPVLRTVLPNVEHRSSHFLNNGLERDHQHVKGRTRPMRQFGGRVRPLPSAAVSKCCAVCSSIPSTTTRRRTDN